MTIDFSALKFSFSKKPLLIGGKAMEYYNLRQAGNDTDFVITKSDFSELVKKHPSSLKDLWGDLGISTDGFEIWKTMDYFDYDYLSQNAVEESNYLVISLEKLLFQKALAMHKPKYQHDLELVVKKIIDTQSQHYEEVKEENEKLLANVEGVQFIEKIGKESLNK